MLPKTHSKHIQYNQWKISVVIRRILPLLISHTSLPSAACHLALYSVVCGYYGADNIAPTWQLVQRRCLLCIAKSDVNKKPHTFVAYNKSIQCDHEFMDQHKRMVEHGG
jgi:hypothetical protein